MSDEAPVVDAQLEHEIKMITLGAQADPSQIPAQFGGDVTKYTNSYREQRASLTRAQQELALLKKAPSPTPPVATDPSTPTPTATENTGDFFAKPDPNAAPAPTDIPWGKIQQEIKVNGQLTDATRKELHEVYKVPQDIIAMHENAFKLQQKAVADEAVQLVGGAAQLDAIKKYVQTNFKADELQALNEGMSRPGWQTLLLGVQARMQNPIKGEPHRSNGAVAAPAVDGPKPYLNQFEVQRAMNDARYGRDVEYTNEVYARIGETNKLSR